MVALTETSARYRQLLEPVLPDGESFELWDIHSHARKCRKLIFTSKHDGTLNTMATHLLLLVHTSDASRKMALLGLEVILYEAPDVVTLFISKADTSGWPSGPRLNILAITQAMLRGMMRYYISDTKRVRVALFAKTMREYLFLGSKANPSKHVLSDQQLVRWWLRCLDGLAGEFEIIDMAKLHLPSSGLPETSFFPPNSSLPWSAGDIWSGSSTEWAVRCIPRFPDDPKTRFLDAIVAENRAKKVSPSQFWTELSMRQEFRLSKSVGVIGLSGFLKRENRVQIEGQHSLSFAVTKKLKDTLLDLDFSTYHNALSSSAKLSERVPEDAVISIKGRRQLPRQNSEVSSSSVQPTKRVNTLGEGLLRKKKKTSI